MKRLSDLCRTEQKIVSLLRTPLWLPRCVSLPVLLLGVWLLTGCGQEPARETAKQESAPPPAAESKPVVEPEQAASPEPAPESKPQETAAEPRETAAASVPNRMIKAREKMKYILLGLMEYYDQHKMFCPDTNHPEYYAPSGRPLLSWRVHILPFMGEEELYQQFKLDEPWDSPHNQRLLAKMPDVYRAPGDPDDSTRTRFRHVESVVDAPDDRPLTMFPVSPGGKSIGFPEMADQMSETILFLEAAPEQATPWTKPDGLPLIRDNPAKAIGLSEPSGTLICFVDGHSSLVKPGTAPEIWSRLLDYADGHAIPEDIFAKFPVPELEPRTNLPLHLAYLESPFMEGLLVLHPRAMVEAKQASEMLNQLGELGLIPALKRWQELETVVIWSRTFGVGFKSHFLIRLAAPEARDEVARKFGLNPDHLWQHDERTWLIAPASLINDLNTREELSEEDLAVWDQMDLKKQLTLRFYIVPSEEESPEKRFLSRTLNCDQLGEINAVDLSADFSGDSELTARLYTSDASVAAQLQKQIQQFQQQLAKNQSSRNSPAEKALADAVTRNLSTSLAVDEAFPETGKSILDLKLKHFDQDAGVATVIKQKLIQPLISISREAQREFKQRDRIKQLGLAFHNYHFNFGFLPPAPPHLIDGKPLLSWRVQLLPFVGEFELYEKFRFDEPWDSPHNLPLLKEMPDVYRSAGVDRPGYTTMMTFSGERTPFDRRPGRSLAGIPDGLENTILCVQAGADRAVPWTKPVDLEFDPKDPWRVVGKLEKNRLLALRMDGAARWIPRSMPDREFAEMIDPDDEGRTTAASLNWETPAEWALLMTDFLENAYARGHLYNAIARAQYAAGARDEALQTLQTARDDIANVEGLFLKPVAEALIVNTFLKWGQFDQAVQQAVKIENLNQKKSAIKQIAFALEEAGKTQQAIDVLRKLENPLEARSALNLLMFDLVEAGKKQEALKMVDQVTGVDQRASALCCIAWALSNQGKMKEAAGLLERVDKLLPQVKEQPSRDLLLNVYVASLARSGNHSKPLELISQIERQDLVENSLMLTAGLLTEAGQIAQGLEVAQKIENPETQVAAFQGIIKSLADRKDFDRAEKIAGELKDEGSRYLAFEAIARGLAKAGKGKETVDVIRQIKFLHNRPFLLREIASSLVKSGKLDSARQIAGLIEEPEFQASYQVDIALALSEQGKLKAAQEMVEQVSVPAVKQYAPVKLATTLAQAGKPEAAQEYLSKIVNPTSRVHVQSEIASAFFRTRHKSEGLAMLNAAATASRQIKDKRVFSSCILMLAAEPLSDHQAAEKADLIPIQLKPSFTAEEKQLAEFLLQAVQQMN